MREGEGGKKREAGGLDEICTHINFEGASEMLKLFCDMPGKKKKAAGVG